MCLKELAIVPLKEALYQNYIRVGVKAYNQHYLHLWEHRDSSPYLKSSFTLEVLKKEQKDSNTELFLIYHETTPVGIVKIIKNRALEPYGADKALLLDKIYVLNEHSGKGIGKKVMDFVIMYALGMNKKIVWLDTMKNGPALQFYLKNGFTIHSETKLKFPTVLNDQRPMYVMYKILKSHATV
ncbi:GNAT family N-acetyltransferase [Flavobacteriaceae bacterium TP-CH-4]|uniref:GNAT family N-acetyltransferase n=1 Tax=Pelagihabitans pacificus TaxID=2696054 RepID=A0A967E4U4_9FLAO|nr:GNAT family N-acetyltransferase [Pelagihabitans pacificus]NHF57885.1 GNAT family N-acetyltransferase [Pelagihabitans pacificus]